MARIYYCFMYLHYVFVDKTNGNVLALRSVVYNKCIFCCLSRNEFNVEIHYDISKGK